MSKTNDLTCGSTVTKKITVLTVQWHEGQLMYADMKLRLATHHISTLNMQTFYVWLGWYYWKLGMLSCRLFWFCYVGCLGKCESKGKVGKWDLTSTYQRPWIETCVVTFSGTFTGIRHTTLDDSEIGSGNRQMHNFCLKSCLQTNRQLTVQCDSQTGQTQVFWARMHWAMIGQIYSYITFQHYCNPSTRLCNHCVDSHTHTYHVFPSC